MTDYHVDEQRVEDNEFESEIEPRHLEEERDEEGDAAPVEREDVGVLHQRQRRFAEVVAEVLRQVSVGEALGDGGAKALHGRGSGFLLDGVVGICGKSEFLPEVARP